MAIQLCPPPWCTCLSPYHPTPLLIAVVPTVLTAVVLTVLIAVVTSVLTAVVPTVLIEVVTTILTAGSALSL